MTADAPVPQRTGRWQPAILWLLPWMFYLCSVTVTVVAANLGGHRADWLHFLTKNEVLIVLAALVVLLWVVVRLTMALRYRAFLFVGVVSLVELPFAFVVFLFWGVGMIGGPINPG